MRPRHWPPQYLRATLDGTDWSDVPKMLSEPEARIAWLCLQADTEFVGRAVGAMRRKKSANFSRVIPLGLVGYFSLFQHEAASKSRLLGLGIPAPMSVPASELSSRARNGLKFFDDSRRSVEEQLAYFRSSIVSVQQTRFLNRARFKFLRTYERDLGLYSYGGRIIATTHGVALTFGIDDIQNDMDSDWLSVFSEFGRFFGALGARLDDPNTSLLGIEERKFSTRDVLSEDFYLRIFNGHETPDLNAMLLVLLAHLNFVDAFIKVPDERHPDYFTSVKIRYIVLFHVLRSLEILTSLQEVRLRAQSSAHISAILSDAFSVTILAEGLRPLRNSFTHYIPDSRLKLDLLDEGDPLFGLLAAAGIGSPRLDFVSQLSQGLARTISILSLWLGSDASAARPM